MEKIFKENGTFKSMYSAQKWLIDNGYSYGSSCVGCNVAIVKGEYTLPQKVKNFSKEDFKKVDGWMSSNDFREGSVKIKIIDK